MRKVISGDYRRQVDRQVKKGSESKVANWIRREKEEVRRVKTSQSRALHALGARRALVHARPQTLAHTPSFSKRLQPAVFVLLRWLLHHVHLNAGWSASLSLSGSAIKDDAHNEGSFQPSGAARGQGSTSKNRHGTSTLRAQCRC